MILLGMVLATFPSFTDPQCVSTLSVYRPGAIRSNAGFSLMHSWASEAAALHSWVVGGQARPRESEHRLCSAVCLFSSGILSNLSVGMVFRTPKRFAAKLMVSCIVYGSLAMNLTGGDYILEIRNLTPFRGVRNSSRMSEVSESPGSRILCFLTSYFLPFKLTNYKDTDRLDSTLVRREGSGSGN